MTPEQKRIKNLRAGLRSFLASRDPENFGCACVPDKHECGPCRARREQQPLRRALKALEETA